MKGIGIYAFLIFMGCFASGAYASAWGPFVSMPHEAESVASALAEYYLDCGAFPPPLPLPPYGLQRLTTPTPYLTALPTDIFAPPQRLTLKRILRVKWDFFIWGLIIIVFLIAGFRTVRKTQSWLVFIPLFFVSFIMTLVYCTSFNGFGFHLFDFSREWLLVNSLKHREGAEYSFLYGLSRDGYGVVVSAGSAFEHRLTQDRMDEIPYMDDPRTYFPANYHENWFWIVGPEYIEQKRLERIEGAEREAM